MQRACVREVVVPPEAPARQPKPNGFGDPNLWFGDPQKHRVAPTDGEDNFGTTR